MLLDPSPRTRDLLGRLHAFFGEHIYPNEGRYHEERETARRAGDAWQPSALVDELKVKAREAGLWNMFLPHPYKGLGGISNLDYAPLCEVMGRVNWSSEVFNCSAPDTGNMETLERYGTDAQKQQMARAAAGRRDPLGVPDDRAGGRVIGRDQHPVQHPPRRRRLRDQRPQVVQLRRRHPALRDLHRHGQDRCRMRRAMRSSRWCWCRATRRRDDGATADRLQLRRCAARPHGGRARQRARAGGEHPAGRGPRLRDRPGAAGPRAHPPLHALDRRGRARAGDDGRPAAGAHGLRQAAVPSSRSGTSASPRAAA